MNYRIALDYCEKRKGAKLFGRMHGRDLLVQPMKCIGGGCDICNKQFYVDVTVRNGNGETTQRFEEATARDLLDAVKRERGIDLRAYLKGNKP